MTADVLEAWLADQDVGVPAKRVMVPLRPRAEAASADPSTSQGGDHLFERFTERARRVMVLAPEHARLLNHNFIGTEHLLLGLIHEGEGVAAKALEQLGISLEAVREKVEETMGAPSTAAGASPPFTPRAKKVLELSLRDALQLGHNYIGTEHILLDGLVREGEGVAARVLVDLGADLSRVRQQVIQPLSGYGSQGKEGSATAAEPIAHPIRACPGCRRLLGELAHMVVSSNAIGTDSDPAAQITLVLVCCPHCSVILGVLPHPK
jgi:ATP-dependent Clp protease ATP-binding subunit ClpA